MCDILFCIFALKTLYVQKILFTFILLSIIYSCRPVHTDDTFATTNPVLLHQAMDALSRTIVDDIFSPPIAVRIYAYPSIAAYEIMAIEDKQYRSLAGRINDLTPVPAPTATINHSLSALCAFTIVAEKLVFSQFKMREHLEKIIEHYRVMEVSEEVIKASIEYGTTVAQHIIAWAQTDNYAETRSAKKYSITKVNNPAQWLPTPPGYMACIEPNWRAIRTFVLDSAQQFTPPAPTPFSIEKDSRFYKEVMEVYEAVKNSSEEHRNIANFWDCNPYVSHHTGHLMHATKKITPGGHWIGIVEQLGAEF